VVTAPPIPVFGVDSGNVNALVVDIPGVTSLFTGLSLVVIPANTNTEAPSVQINALSPAAITQGATPVGAGALVAGAAAQMIYDGTNFQLLNSASTASSAPQPGDIKATASGNAPPGGWDWCFGKTYNRTTNAALFAAIGTSWGAGDGATTFLGPDFRGRTLAGVDAMGGSAANRLTSASMSVTASLGVTGGSEDVQSHNHTISDPDHEHTIPGDIANGTGSAAFSLSQTGSNFVSFGASSTTSPAATGITLANYGTGASQNVQPTAVVNWIMYVG
jgi:microcystin-dependent protein